MQVIAVFHKVDAHVPVFSASVDMQDCLGEPCETVRLSTLSTSHFIAFDSDAWAH